MAGAGGLPVPVMLSLTSWPEDSDFEQWMGVELATQFGLTQRTADSLVRDGLILPILDSLDEVDGRHGARASFLVDKINQFLATNPDVRIIIASRDDGQRGKRELRRLRGFEVWTIESLTMASASDYIAEMCTEETWPNWEGLLKEATQQSPLSEVLTVPWRLAMAVSYHAQGGDLEMLRPIGTELADYKAGRNTYTERVEPILYREFVHSRAKHYGKSPAQTLTRLRNIAVALEDKGPPGKVNDTIALHEWWKWVDQVSLWRHRAMISFLAIQLPFGLYGYLLDYLPDGHSRTGSPWIVALGLLANYLLLMSVTNVELRMKATPTWIRMRLVRSDKTYRLAAVTVVAAVFVGVLALFGLNPRLALAGFGVVAVYAAVGAFSGPRDLSIAQSPLAILRGDLVASLLLGAAFGLVQAFTVWDLLGAGVAISFMVAYAVGSAATSAHSRYLVAVYLSGTRYGIPFGYYRFLRWASKAGLLRMSGVAYQFRHVGLQRYLVTTHD
jgi:hypothetical protein